MELLIAKVTSVVCVLILALFFGTLPYCLILARRNDFVSSRRERIVRYLNCFSGGVFLGALFLDLVPEGSEQFEKYKELVNYHSEYPFYNAIIIFGFFLTSCVEYFAHAVLTPVEHSTSVRVRVPSTVENGESECLQDGKTKGYGTVASERAVSTQSDQLKGTTISGTGNSDLNQGEKYANNVCPSEDDKDLTVSLVSVVPASCRRTYNIRSVLLLLALSFHSIFDGLALGLQESSSKVWEIFGAVALHKCIVAACLGLDIFMNFSDTKIAALLMVIFSLISPIGASIGISVTSAGIDETAQSLSSGILQGLSCGAFLYVTFLEILSTYWKDGSCDRSFLDIICSMIGFSIMALLKILDT